MIVLLAFVWAGMLVFVALAAYSYGWWWRGRHERDRWADHERYLRREWEREQRQLRHEDCEPERPSGPPQLRVVE